jgi:hypothetical protein
VNKNNINKDDPAGLAEHWDDFVRLESTAPTNLIRRYLIESLLGISAGVILGH